MSHWYRRLGFQLWLWAVLPLTLMLVAVSLNGVYSHQVAMRDFVAERDLGMARLYAGAVQNALANGTVLANGTGLSQVLGAIPVGPHTMLYLADADTDEMAAVLGISVGNVRVKLHRIRRQLRSALEKESHGPG